MVTYRKIVNRMKIFQALRLPTLIFDKFYHKYRKIYRSILIFCFFDFRRKYGASLLQS